jgi:hypothetical protein
LDREQGETHSWDLRLVSHEHLERIVESKGGSCAYDEVSGKYMEKIQIVYEKYTDMTDWSYHPNCQKEVDAANREAHIGAQTGARVPPKRRASRGNPNDHLLRSKLNKRAHGAPLRR